MPTKGRPLWYNGRPSRLWCYMFHWQKQRRFVTPEYYGWVCSRCGEEWRVYSKPDERVT